MTLLLVGFITVAVLVYLGSLDWQKSVKAALVLVVVEGALRKWALPQASFLLFFVKDFVLLGAYVKFFGPSVQKQIAIPGIRNIAVIIGLTLAWGIVQAFNPSLGSLEIGILGLKNYFLYIPLLWIVPAMFTTEEALYRFLRHYLLLLIPVGMLAIAQFFSPPDSPLNVYAAGAQDLQVALGGDLKSVRVTGTFPYIAGYAVYIGFCLSLLLPMLALRQAKWWRWATIAELALVVITSFMTGSRGLVGTSLIFLSGYVLLLGVNNASVLFQSVRSFLLPSLLAAGAVVWGFSAAINSFWLRVSDNQDIPDRVTGIFSEILTNFQFKDIDGFGIGATYQANTVFRDLLDLPPGEVIPVFFESEPGRIALELGPFGFVAWFGLKLILLFMLWQLFNKLKRPFLKQLALSTFLFQSLTITGQIVFNPTANLFHWFLFSFVFLLPHIETMTNWHEYQRQLQFHESSSYLP